MARTTVLTDELWTQLQNTMKQHGCYITKNTSTIMEAIIWKLRTGAPWRDIPKELVSWKTAYNCFNRWSENGLWEKFFLAYEKKLIRNGDSSTQAMYGVISMQVELGLVKTGQLDKAVVEELQKSIYVVMPMDIRSILKSLGAGARQSGCKRINSDGWRGRLSDADKGYDSDAIREADRKQGIHPVIPKRRTAKEANIGFDRYLYKLRHLIENLFARLKQFRSIATRYEKLARNFKSMLYLACMIIRAKLN